MKVALLMSGQCRQLWLTSLSIYKNVIEPNNADVFLYLTENSLEPVCGDDTEEIVKKAFPANVKSLVFTDQAWDEEAEALIKSNYEKIDRLYKSLGRDKWDKQLNHHNTKQYLQLKKCAEAAVAYADANGFKYDLMVRCRPDIGWLNHFNLTLPTASSTIYCNYSQHNCSITQEPHLVPWVEDTCFFGDQDSMLKLCQDFSDKMVEDLEVCAEAYDLTFATEKLLAQCLINTGIKFEGINDYFGTNSDNWIRPKLSKHWVDWTKSPNYPLVKEFCGEAKTGLAVYFDRIGQENIIFDPSII